MTQILWYYFTIVKPQYCSKLRSVWFHFSAGDCADSLLAAGPGDKRVALVVEVGAIAKLPEVGLPKQQKLQDGYPHTLECMVSGTKQYA